MRSFFTLCWRQSPVLYDELGFLRDVHGPLRARILRHVGAKIRPKVPMLQVLAPCGRVDALQHHRPRTRLRCRARCRASGTMRNHASAVLPLGLLLVQDPGDPPDKWGRDNTHIVSGLTGV